MTDTTQRQAKLAQRLYDMTKKKKINWKYDSFDDNVTAEFSKNKIAVEDGRDSEGSPFIMVTIYSLSDEEIDKFNDEDLKNLSTSDPEYSSFWKLMSQTLNLAKRQARGADDAIDDILDELDDDDVPF